MKRFSLLATLVCTLMVLAGCGASVNGSSTTFRNEADLSVTASFDQGTATPGTNLIETLTISNNGPRDAFNLSITQTDLGWPTVTGRPELRFDCEATGEGNIEVGDDGSITADLENGTSATCVGRVPVYYASDSDATSVSLETCISEDADNPDPDTSNNCATADATVGQQATIVDYRDEIIYWAFTDRFNNGDPSNDNGNGDRLGDTANPGNPKGWHGGDFAGIAAKIDEGYFQAMGFTTIWISPVVLQIPGLSADDVAYHAYWLENYDDQEPHFGTWAELSSLVETAHAAGLKIIIDLVVNHAGYDALLVGSEPDWFRTGGDCGPDEDPITDCLAGLPDIKQEVAQARQWALDGAQNILLQSGADGFRIDTYKHVNEDFWFDFFASDAVGDRSSVFSVGEFFSASSNDMAQTLDRDGSPSVFDFPLYGAINNAMALRAAATDSIAGIFGNDNIFQDPSRLTTFIDNHDVPRFVTQATTSGATTDEATERLDMALGLIYGARGIPSVYYGTEVALPGGADPDNRRQMVFPGDAVARLAKANPQAFFGKATCGVTGSGDPTEAYGVEFYVRGSFDDWANPPSATSQFQNLGSNIYEAEFEIVAGTYDFKMASEDWSTVDYTGDGVINLDEMVTLVPGLGALNTTITLAADGCYNFQADVTDTGAPILTVTMVTLDGPKTTCGVTGTGDPTEAYGVEFYVRGSFDDWANPPSATSQFQNLGSNIYEAEFEIVAGTYDFKMASEDWSTVDYTGDGVINLDEMVTLVPGLGALNTTITLAADGCYNFQADVTDTGAPILTVTMVTLDGPKTTCGVTGTGDPTEAYGVEFYVRGSFDDWANPPSATSQFQNLGSNIYEAEFEIVAGTYDFKMASEDWSTVDYTGDGVINLDEMVTLVPGLGALNTTITLAADGCYNFRSDVTDTGAPILTVTEVAIEGGGPGDGRDVDLVDRLTRYAAARQGYPALRRGDQATLYDPSGACTAPETGNDPAEAFGVAMFARGSFNGWSDPPPASDQFMNQGGGIYQARVSLAVGDQRYKVAAADWSAEWAYIEAENGNTLLDTEVTMAPAAGSGTEGQIAVADDGCYAWTMDANDTDAPTLIVSQLFAGSPTDVMAISRSMTGEATVVVVVNNEDEDVDLSTLPDGGIPLDGALADGAVTEITGSDTDLAVSGGVLIGTVPARTTYLVVQGS